MTEAQEAELLKVFAEAANEAGYPHACGCLNTCLTAAGLNGYVKVVHDKLRASILAGVKAVIERSKLFELGVWTDGECWVVAKDAEDALQVFAEASGELVDNYDVDDWRREEDDKVLTVVDDEDNSRESKTAKEWVQDGRRYLFGLNW